MQQPPCVLITIYSHNWLVRPWTRGRCTLEQRTNSSARVEEDAGLLFMRAPAQPPHPVRTQREPICRCVEAHVYEQTTRLTSVGAGSLSRATYWPNSTMAKLEEPSKAISAVPKAPDPRSWEQAVGLPSLNHLISTRRVLGNRAPGSQIWSIAAGTPAWSCRPGHSAAWR